MRAAVVLVCAALTAQSLVSPCPGCGYPPEALDDSDHTGWSPLFDGHTLSGWDGNPDVWRVQEGAIMAESTATRRVGTTYLIWAGGQPADFELKLQIKADSDIHSGVFYRGTVGPAPPRTPSPARSGVQPANRPQQTAPAIPADPRWNVRGYALDFDYGLDNDGNVQDTTRSEVQIGWRGHIVRMEAGKRPTSIGALGDRDAMKAFVRQGEWNQLHVIARGSTLTHIVNGHVMAVVVDDDAGARKTSGVIALQIEQFGTGKIWFRDIWLKQ